MIAAELRGGSKPSLNEALGWIGSRVDDIYGANVGRLEDVWIDPGTGVPRWLLVKEGRFGGRTTLIPFEDATAGAGHVWVPYERDVVRAAPEIEPGAPLTQHVEASLRTHYAASAPNAISHGSPSRPPAGAPVEPARIGPQHGSAMGTATIRFHSPPEAGPPEFFSARGDSTERQAPTPPQRPVIRGPQAASRPPQSSFAPRLPERPAPPIGAPEPPRQPAGGWSSAPAAQPGSAPAYPQHQPAPAFLQPDPAPAYAQPDPAPAYAQPQPGSAPPTPQPRSRPAYAQPQPGSAPPTSRGAPAWQPAQPDPAQGPVDQLRALAEAGGSHYVEIELSGELTIRGELRSVRVTPREPRGPQPG